MEFQSHVRFRFRFRLLTQLLHSEQISCSLTFSLTHCCAPFAAAADVTSIRLRCHTNLLDWSLLHPPETDSIESVQVMHSKERSSHQMHSRNNQENESIYSFRATTLDCSQRWLIISGCQKGDYFGGTSLRCISVCLLSIKFMAKTWTHPLVLPVWSPSLSNSLQHLFSPKLTWHLHLPC